MAIRAPSELTREERADYLVLMRGCIHSQRPPRKSHLLGQKNAHTMCTSNIKKQKSCLHKTTGYFDAFNAQIRRKTNKRIKGQGGWGLKANICLGCLVRAAIV